MTILTLPCGGVTVICGTGFLLAFHTCTVNGWVLPGGPTTARSTITTAWMPLSWLFGPSTRTVVGVIVVWAVCSWNPAGRVLTRSIETVWVELPRSSMVTVTELGATMVTFGSAFWTSTGTLLVPTLTLEKFPVTCREASTKCARFSVVPITVACTGGTLPTTTRPAGNPVAATGSW